MTSESICVGGVVQSLNYEALLQKFGCVGVHVAFGGTNHGKTKAAELSLAMAGLHNVKYTQMTEALLRKLLFGSMPWVYDDPSDTGFLQTILIDVFGGAGIGNSRRQGSAQAAPIVTANEFILDILREKDER